MDIANDPKFWKWISDRKNEESFKPIPLYQYVDIPTPELPSDSNDSNVTNDFTIDNTVYQL